ITERGGLKIPAVKFSRLETAVRERTLYACSLAVHRWCIMDSASPRSVLRDRSNEEGFATKSLIQGFLQPAVRKQEYTSSSPSSSSTAVTAAALGNSAAAGASDAGAAAPPP
ncbi:unnamed protein product, partial [Ectocarpus sp. 12 AP-2014]